MSFKMEPTAELRNRRRSIRHPLQLKLKSSGFTAPDRHALLHNLSETGLLLETNSPLSIDEVLSIELPHVGSRQAQVVWTGGHFSGCSFLKPISPATISAALLKNPVPTRTPDASQASPEHPGQLAMELRMLREQRRLSVEELANLVGVSRQSVWYWENGRSTPGAANLTRLEEALEASLLGLDAAAPAAQEYFPNSTAAELVGSCKTRIANALNVAEEKVQIVIQL